MQICILYYIFIDDNFKTKINQKINLFKEFGSWWERRLASPTNIAPPRPYHLSYHPHDILV